MDRGDERSMEFGSWKCPKSLASLRLLLKQYSLAVNVNKVCRIGPELPGYKAERSDDCRWNT